MIVDFLLNLTYLHQMTYVQNTENAHLFIWTYLFIIATLGPPILSTYATASALNVQATLPLGPNGKSIEHLIGRSNNWSSEMQVSYTLNITNPEWAAQVNLSLIWSFVCTNTLNQSNLYFEPMFVSTGEGKHTWWSVYSRFKTQYKVLW